MKGACLRAPSIKWRTILRLFSLEAIPKRMTSISDQLTGGIVSLF